MHVCARCPRVLGRSCCEPDDDHGLATLSSADIARIQAATRRAQEHFVALEPFTPEESHAHAQLRPANAHATQNGARRHLRARDGACVFHDEKIGCTLPVDARPLACRLYPFELDSHGRLRVEPSGRCHAEETSGDLESLLAALGHTQASVRALHRQHCEELRADARSPAK